ncbi:beta-D-xylosidase 1-like [Lytechinus variegatus]|uniref:beta-D-xylosidase 1-like n=1 Tax=Lytechinus variegatus TaxID=7654 RepID=UPI001BB1749E|nr:beta-D-xylosidase 1-like [Lytechinus variegatus]
MTRKIISFAGLFIFALIRISVGNGEFASKSELPFWNHSLPWDQRLDDLLNRLKVDDMTYQLARGGADPNGPAPGISRLQIGKYVWNTECLRGDAQAKNATAFPQALGLAAAFSRDLLFQVANATGYEVRAKNNYYKAHGDFNNHQGLSCFSPVINIMRHPYWGRNQETYGEDPYLTGELAKSFVRGLQGNHPRYILANAGCKHFAAYSGPENYPSSRFSFNAKVSDKDLQVTFFPAFKECIKAGTYSFMCSYNSVNGIPACANTYLLTDVLRKEWGFKGYVVSDQRALELEEISHNYTTSYLETAVKSLKAGCNLDLGHNLPAVYDYLTEAVQLGMLTIKDLRDSLSPLFYTRLRLGEFDPVDLNPYAQLNADQVVLSPEHQQLAVKAALKSFVLIKNERNTLPIEGIIQTLAVVGPFANNSNLLFGDYAPEPDSRFVTTVLEGLSPIATKTRNASGCPYPKCEAYDQQGVMNAVAGADMVVVCLGTGIGIEMESNDRHDMLLPGKQEQLLQDAVRYASGRPVILLLFNAGPLNITWAMSSPSVQAIIECFFPSQATGVALRMMFQNAPGSNPGGRLPSTWPAMDAQIPPMENYSMDGRTYRYFHGDPLLPFGYGLSYTLFNYSDLMVTPASIQPCQNVTVKVTVKNIGNYTGDEVTQVYISWQNISTKMPIRQLVDFTREELAPGKSVSLEFKIVPRVMAVYTDHWFLEPCTIDVFVGGQQPGQKVRAPSNVLNAKFQIAGVVTPLSKCPYPG